MIRVRRGPAYRAIRAGEPVPEAANWNAGMKRKMRVEEVPDEGPVPMPEPDVAVETKTRNSLLDFVGKGKKPAKKKNKKKAK